MRPRGKPKAHKTPSAATAETHKSGLEITADISLPRTLVAARGPPDLAGLPQPLTEVRVTDRERQARMLAVMAAVDSADQSERRRQRAMPQVAEL
jgi:hypothetical protein